MNILITTAGRRVSLVRHFQKELKKHFPEGKVFAGDLKPQLSSACHVADYYFQLPGFHDSNYINYLKGLITEHNISLIIPTHDQELMSLSKNQESLKALGAIVVISSPEIVYNCRDKRLIHKFFRSKDIDTAKEFSKTQYELPFFIKPYDGSRSEDTYIIRHDSEIRPYHLNNEKLMFLEYLDHKDYEEYTCDFYYDKTHKLRCLVPRKRIEVRDGEVNKALTERNAIIPYLRQRLDYLEGAVGCLTGQFFKHTQSNRIVGIEINPRFGGGFPLTYHAGANYPAWIIKEYLLGKSIPDQFDSWEENLLMMRYDDEVLRHGYKG